MLTRREFNAGVLGGLVLPAVRRRAEIESIEPLGMLVRECSLPGETRADDVVPAHPNGLQVARDRWLLVCATRGFRGVDDDRSIVYQLRRGGPEGAVIKEGFLARTRNDWDPFGEGKALVKQHGHPVAFGVPKGARIGGKPAAQANVFVAKWRVVARILDKEKNYLERTGVDQRLADRSQSVEWVQFRLNEREDDVEIIKPVAPLRQKGHEKGDRFTSAEDAGWMNQSFTPAVPFNREATEWADCNHFDRGRVAALKYRFNAETGLYEWVETGPFLAHPKAGLIEASLARAGGSWIVCARLDGQRGAAWIRAEDPFARLPEPTLAAEPAANAPLTAFTCGDGALRLFTGDPTVSPSKNGRDPLYAWEVDVEKKFAASGRRVIFDTSKAGLPIRRAAEA
jgi:hypothetical protein